VLPAAALGYGCLKPAVAGIGRLDDRLWDRVTVTGGTEGRHPETVLQWAPSAAVYGLDAMGVGMRHRFREHLLLDAGSVVIAGGAGWVLRRLSAGMPGFGLRDGTEFPSGHTTNAFRGAELLRQELRSRSPVMSWAGYGMALLVAGLRMRHGQHQFSEVVAGAGLGVLSTKAVYLLKSGLERRHGRTPGRRTPAGGHPSTGRDR
jgi:membrane-associated phospholipid phosphatase